MANNGPCLSQIVEIITTKDIDIAGPLWCIQKFLETDSEWSNTCNHVVVMPREVLRMCGGSKICKSRWGVSRKLHIVVVSNKSACQPSLRLSISWFDFLVLTAP